MWHEHGMVPGMTGRPGTGKARARGNIEVLRSGALRVRVYAGIDPVTKKRHNLIEVIPPSPRAWCEAEDARTRLVQQVVNRRNPWTSATVDELLSRYFGQFPGAPTTLDLYRHTPATTSHRSWDTSKWDGSTRRRWTCSTPSCDAVVAGARAVGGRSTTGSPATTSAPSGAGRTCVVPSHRPRSVRSTSSSPAPSRRRSVGDGGSTRPRRPSRHRRRSRTPSRAPPNRPSASSWSRGAIPTGERWFGPR
jgi:hypothetical protein